MTTRVSPPASGDLARFGSPDNWPLAHQVDGFDKLAKLLDTLHEHALVAWDRDVHLMLRELGDEDSPTGGITVVASDHTGPGGADILGYVAYVDQVTIYQLTRVADDPLGVRWIDCSASSTWPLSLTKACGTGYGCANCDREFCWTCDSPMPATASNAGKFQIKTIGSRYCEDPACLTAESTAHGLPIEVTAQLRKKWRDGRYVHLDCLNREMDVK